MIKKKYIYINNMSLKLFLSLLKKNKKNIKLNNLNKKKNILIKNYLKQNNLVKYKKYKLLNLNILQKKKKKI